MNWLRLRGEDLFSVVALFAGAAIFRLGWEVGGMVFHVLSR